MKINFYTPSVRKHVTRLTDYEVSLLDIEHLQVFTISVTAENPDYWTIHFNDTREIHDLFERINGMSKIEYLVSDFCDAKFSADDLLQLLSKALVTMVDTPTVSGRYIIQNLGEMDSSGPDRILLNKYTNSTDTNDYQQWLYQTGPFRTD